MSTKTYQTYQLDEPARGEFTAHGRRIPFALEAGEHQAKSSDQKLVLEGLISLGTARVAEKRIAKKEQPEASVVEDKKERE